MDLSVPAILGASAVLFVATGLQITGESEEGGPEGPVTGMVTMIVAFIITIPALDRIATAFVPGAWQFVAVVVIGTVWTAVVGVGGMLVGERLRTVIGLDHDHDVELHDWEES